MSMIDALPPDSLRLLLIDEDPLFRLGMSIWLNQLPDMTLVAEAENGETALQILDRQFEAAGAESRSLPINLVLLNPGLGRLNPSQIQGLNLCRLIKSRYPSLPVLCLGDLAEPVVLAAAQQSGANGYCPKSLDASELATVIRRVATGQNIWAEQLAATPVQPPVAPRTMSRTPPQTPPRSRLRLAPFRRRLRVSGLEQIEAALSEVAAELQNLDLSLLDRAILAGKLRELRAARWMVSGLLATPSLADEPPFPRPQPPVPPPVSPAVARQAGNQRSGQAPPARPSPPAGQLVRTSSSSLVEVQDLPVQQPVQPPVQQPVQQPEIQKLAFDALTAKLQSGLTNLSEIPLEIDILREDKKRELLYLAIRKLEDLLSELRYSQIAPDQLPAKRDLVLLDLWQAMLVDFFGKYYTVRLRTQSGETDVEVLEVLLRDAAVVEAEILHKIPGVIELLQHLLFQLPLSVDSRPYASGNPESLARAELLLENLVIQLANAVMQPLLNHFASVETIKSSFYDRRLLSSREIERFRNSLSWRYRLERLYREPKNIFESQYKLFTLTGRGIRQTLIYAPRTSELSELSGLPYVVTLVLETRDAVAPQIRSVLSFMGNSFVYVLTELLGRGIGLVGKGVLKGLGNVWQETKPGRDRQR